MPFDELDTRIKEAGTHHRPPQQPAHAWEKMHALLNEHMPEEKKDRKRIVFFWLIILFLLAGGGVFLRSSFNKRSTTTGQVAVNTVKNDSSANIDTPIPPHNTKTKTTTIETGITPANSPVIHPIAAGKNAPVNGDREFDQERKELSSSAKVTKPVALREILEPTKTSGDQRKSASPVLDKKVDDATTLNGQVRLASNLESRLRQVFGSFDSLKSITFPDKLWDEEKDSATVATKSESNIDSLSKELRATAAQKNNGTKKKNSFFFSVSAGTDISAMDIGGIGKLRLRIGAGIGYTLQERITLRTGFYVVNKVYTASPDEYHPDVMAPNYRYVTDINANCRVYEIPVSVAWNFKPGKQTSTFAAVGLSSYLMNKESYDYNYKYPSGTVATRNTTVHNDNQHFFSVLNLSAGYQRKISNRVTVVAEPYIALPLKRIGLGHVKLQGAGISLTATIRPFK